MSVYSLQQVEDGNVKGNELLVIHNNVYNIASFIDEHPGGEDVLRESVGKDATESFEDVGHSDDARTILEKYKIGTLDDASRKEKHDFKPLRAGELPEEEPRSSLLRYLVPTLLVAGMLVYKYTLGRQRH